jgi:hypothetical protein
MASPKSDEMPASRPLAITALSTAGHLVLSALGLYFIQVEPQTKSLQPSIEAFMEAGKLSDGITPLHQTFTGFAPVDWVLQIIIMAFAGGPFWMDRGVTVMQSYFLIHCAAVISIWTIEGCRTRNRWNFLSL